MSFITGREIIIGVAKASTWRTAVALGAGDGILIQSESMGAKAPNFVPDDSLGQADIKCLIKTNENQTGSLQGYLRLEGWDVMLALALGTAGTPTQISGTAYYNNYSPADAISGLFATLAIKKADTTKGIWEIPSMKVTGFTLSAEIGALAQITFNEMGNKIETENPVNTTVTLGNVTYPTGCRQAKMDDRFKMRMNDQTGGALSDSDQIYPSSFELTYNRPHDDNYQAGYDDMSEPVQSGFSEATVTLTFDKYNIDDFMTAISTNVDKKMDILFEGDLISGGGGERYQMLIQLPKITWSSGSADVGGAGTIPHVVEGTLLVPDTAPTGMTTVDPVNIYVQNTRTTDPLA